MAAFHFFPLFGLHFLSVLVPDLDNESCIPGYFEETALIFRAFSMPHCEKNGNSNNILEFGILLGKKDLLGKGLMALSLQ
jgi:hypothetical protein